MNKKLISFGLSIYLLIPNVAFAKGEKVLPKQPTKQMEIMVKRLPTSLPRLKANSFTFIYPDAVRGIYVNAHSIGGSKWNQLIDLVKDTELNAMVIDYKEDHGNLTFMPEEGSPYRKIGTTSIKNMTALLEQLEKEKIYPIARIVVFKDSVLAEAKPEWSFMEGKKLWTNGGGEAFVNPFEKKVWDYNVNLAIEAAKMGFQEIQFDYVRFPEGFEHKGDKLSYSKGDYEKLDISEGEKRVEAVTDFVQYAKEKLEPYDVKVSVDIFGYTATLNEAPGIGQNFSRISNHVDVISSMIYPSHWTNYFGIEKPDLHPYELVSEYIKVEKQKLNQLEHAPISRPWLQDFTATWLGKDNYQVYGKEEIQKQIKALNDQGVSEFLLWNAGNNYTKNVNYKPINKEEKGD
ncbi:putative glycoside hydrolase [Niallia sp.]|uniref:putative glycoside hydrolase n=1 Tax=Niallia sp. TaxID=2837523 RepID=UPI0028A0B3DC|nr:putative glycoside hydrolase [Niallia sp.]